MGGIPYDLQLQDQGNRIHLWQADGRRIDFRHTGDAPNGERLFQAAQHSDGQLTAHRSGYTWNARDGSRLHLSASGQPRSLQQGAEVQLRFSHDTAGRLTRIEAPRTRHSLPNPDPDPDPDFDTGLSVFPEEYPGPALRLEYDAQGHLHRLIDPAGHITGYAYDDQQRLQRVDHPDGTARHYHYENPDHPYHLTGISVREAQDGTRDVETLRIATWQYDEQGRATAYKPADPANALQIDFAAPDLTRITDARGRVSTYRTGLLADSGIP